LYTLLVPIRTSNLLSDFFNSQGGPEFIPSYTAYYFSLHMLSFDQSLWSVTVEAGASLFVPLISLVVLRRKLSLISQFVVFVALVIAHDIMIKSGNNWFAFLFCFYIGIAAYGFLPNLQKQRSQIRLGTLIAGAVTILTGGWLFMNYGTPAWRVAEHVIISLGAGLFLCAVATYEIKQNSSRAIGVAVLFGDISYSFYAFHMIVLHALYMQTYPMLIGATGPLQHGALLATSLAYGVVATLLTIPLAYLSMRLIENPTRLGRGPTK
jgi:peptidoglycan/LPS O-acetylase OafA/YrhL